MITLVILVKEPVYRPRVAVQDRFRDTYNHRRPHRELGLRTPTSAHAALPKAEPTGDRRPGHYRLRYDRLDALDKMSFRRAGRLHHLGAGYAHASKRVPGHRRRNHHHRHRTRES